MDDPGRPETPVPGADRSHQPAASRKLGGLWNLPDFELEDPPEPGRPAAGLVTFHYLRAAVRRRWLRCLLPGIIGPLLAAGFLVGSAPTATTTLLLTHAAKADTTDPLATDTSLLTTRAVAERTIGALGLTMSPQDFLATVNVVPSQSSDVLQLTMTGPTTTEAVRRLSRFSQDYLDFRSEQILAQSTALIQGYTSEIDGLQAQVNTLNDRIQAIAKSGATSTDTLTTAVAQRQGYTDQINTLQSERQDLTLQENSIKVASRVIDPAAPEAAGGKKHIALVLATGLIAGLALGFGVTVLQAILSDRLWLRTEVSSALKTTVPLSVRRLAPPSRLAVAFSFLPLIRPRYSRRSVDRQLVAHAIAKAVPEPGRRQSLTVLCVGNSDEMRFGVVAAAAELRRRGAACTIIDLTVSGRVEAAVGKLTKTGSGELPEVFRPHVVPSLSKGPADLGAADWDDVALAKAKNGVNLVIADFDPSVGVDYLTAWSERVIVAITAGKTGAELARTTGELVRVADLRLQHAVLLGGRGNDISSGFATLSEEDVAEPSSMGRPDSDTASGRSQVQ